MVGVTDRGLEFAQRAGTVLLVALLVGSLVAPIATQPAAAQTGDNITIKEDCGAVAKFAFPRSCHAAEAVLGSVDTSQSSSAISVDVHTTAQGVYEGYKSHDTTYQNYLQDTEALASLEARHAIATAYENNKTATEAQSAGQQAINDYYAHHQRQILERVSADTAELAYLANVTRQDPNISHKLIHGWPPEYTAGSENLSTVVLPETHTDSYNLTNGSTANVEMPRLKVWQSTSSNKYNMTFSWWDSSREAFRWEFASNIGEYYTWDGGYQTLNVPAADLESKTVYDYRRPRERLEQLDQQAQTVSSNYPSSVAEDLYAAMDSGELTPSEVRGAEGMIRYTAGNATEGEDLEMALRYNLDLEQPESMDSSMKIHFDGKTDRIRNESVDGTVSYEYTSVNQTYEGIVFASGVPNGSIQTGTTYNVSNFDGQPTILTNGSEVVMWDGHFTVTEMYDSDGNAINSTTYSGPTYKSYNATEFIWALENASDARGEIVNDDGGGGGGGIGGIGDLFGNNPAIGMVVVVAVVGLFAAGKLSN